MTQYIIHYIDLLRQQPMTWPPILLESQAKEQAQKLELNGNRVEKIVNNETGKEVIWK